MNEKINIFIVDDHDMLREGMKFYLEMIDDFNIVGEAGNGKEFFEKLDDVRVDIAILDIHMPGESGVQIATRLKSEYPWIKVIIYSANIDRESIAGAIHSGAAGCMPKDAAKTELPEAIRTVYKGQKYISPAISGIVMEVMANREEDNELQQTDLSDREKEILVMIAEGLSYKEIADQLHISTRTVETHKNNMIEKLHLNNKVELIRYALKKGIAEL